MAEENPKGLEGQGEESSSKSEELFSGPIESPKGDGSKVSESPKVEATPEPQDSELEGIFTDLEGPDIPEVLRPRAEKVKKKLQGFFTKKNQTISQEVETLKKNQITEDIRKGYEASAYWGRELQTNPVEGLKRLASQLGISLEALVSRQEAKPTKDELTLQDVTADPTAEKWAAFSRQEARKLVEEFREKEVKPLQEALSKYEGRSTQKENIERGAQAVEEAKALPGFVDNEGKVTKEGNEAIASVLKGEYFGPNALKNAFKAIMADTLSAKVKAAEERLNSMKANVRGVTLPPGGQIQKVISLPSKPEDLWNDLRSEPLSVG